MLYVTGVYLRDITNMIFVIFHLNVSWLSVCSYCCRNKSGNNLEQVVKIHSLSLNSDHSHLYNMLKSTQIETCLQWILLHTKKGLGWVWVKKKKSIYCQIHCE